MQVKGFQIEISFQGPAQLDATFGRHWDRMYDDAHQSNMPLLALLNRLQMDRKKKVKFIARARKTTGINAVIWTWTAKFGVERKKVMVKK